MHVSGERRTAQSLGPRLDSPSYEDKDMDKFLNSIPVTSKSDLSPSQQEPIYSSTQLNGAQPTFSSPYANHGVHSTLSPKATPFQQHSVVVETSSKLVAATMEQNLVNRQLAISGQLPKISIPVFSAWRPSRVSYMEQFLQCPY